MENIIKENFMMAISMVKENTNGPQGIFTLVISNTTSARGLEHMNGAKEVTIEGSGSLIA